MPQLMAGLSFVGGAGYRSAALGRVTGAPATSSTSTSLSSVRVRLVLIS